MTKLEELIQELCPDGVEIKRIGDVAEVGTRSSNGNEAEDEGEYPFFIRSQTVKAKNDYEYDEEAIIIPGEGGVGDIYHYISGKYALHQRVYRIHFTERSINTKFAYHYFRAFFKAFIMKKAVSATVTSIRKPMIQNFEMPVPPLGVQSEIVRILDNFTELTARKQQYSYYRDSLLTFDNSVPLIALAELCDIGDGLHGTPEYNDNGEYYFINGNNLSNGRIVFDAKTKRISSDEYEKIKIPFGETLLYSINGTIGNIALYNNENIALGKSAAYFTVTSDKLLLKYLFYVLQSGQTMSYFEKNLTGSTIKNLGLKTLRDYKIALPPLDVQNRLVEVLDNFDAICTDLNIGLPAEIEARKKQYEYYRDKLLTFKTMSNQQ